MEEEIMDRQKVINLVNLTIEERMPAHRMEVCYQFARQYGQECGISDLIEDWIRTGKEIDSTEDAQQWANDLP